MRTRAFGTLQGYENATGRRRVALKDFVSARRGGNGLFVSPGRAAAAEKAAASRKEKEDKKAKKDSWFECEFNCSYEYNNQRVVEVQFPQVSLKQFELLQAQQRLSSAQMGMQMGFMPQTIPGMPPYANFPLNQTQQIGGAAMPNSNTGAGSAVAGAAGSGAGAGRGTDSVTGNSQDLGAADDANAGIATEYAFDASMDDEAAPGAIEAVVKSAAANAEQFVEQGKSGNHQCGWCGVSFARSDGLVRHFKRCKKMPGGCNHYAELAYKLTLDKLRGIATGQEVKDGFKCAKCDLVFARNDGLSRHLGLSGSRANSCTGVATTVKKVGLTNLSEVEQKALAEVEKMLEQRKGPAL